MFNAFKYTKQLEDVGFTREQAEVQLQLISEIVEGELATKQDLNILKRDLVALETNLSSQITHVKSDLENKIIQSEYRLTIKLGSLLVLGFSTIATLMRFWIR